MGQKMLGTTNSEEEVTVIDTVKFHIPVNLPKNQIDQIEVTVPHF